MAVPAGHASPFPVFEVRYEDGATTVTTVLVAPPVFTKGVQVGWAVWNAPLEGYVVEYGHRIWRRAIGVTVYLEHSHHDKVWGWLRDYADEPIYPRPYGARSYFRTLMCADCKTFFSELPEEVQRLQVATSTKGTS
jgi:hypothetical protein